MIAYYETETIYLRNSAAFVNFVVSVHVDQLLRLHPFGLRRKCVCGKCHIYGRYMHVVHQT